MTGIENPATRSSIARGHFAIRGYPAADGRRVRWGCVYRSGLLHDASDADLLEEAAGFKGTKEAGARQMFQSVQRFKTLPDYVQVWPAHGAGSACGVAKARPRTAFQ